jgi:lantibiotic modifying enzyme
MTFVEHYRCPSPESIRRFYFRWGAQTVVAQLLGCADLHRQNWVASGEHPVLVDAEMLGRALVDLSPIRRPIVAERLHPLLRTGLLPLFRQDGVGPYRYIAPFEGTSVHDERQTFWPAHGGRVHPPGPYTREIVEGFLSASGFLEDTRRRAAFQKLIQRASRRPHLRVLKRATTNYYRLLDDSLHPQHMQASGQRLEYLLARCGRDEAGNKEAQSLYRCCIPRFMINLRALQPGQKFVPSARAMVLSTRILASRLAPAFAA